MLLRYPHTVNIYFVASLWYNSKICTPRAAQGPITISRTRALLVPRGGRRSTRSPLGRPNPRHSARTRTPPRIMDQGPQARPGGQATRGRHYSRPRPPRHPYSAAPAGSLGLPATSDPELCGSPIAPSLRRNNQGMASGPLLRPAGTGRVSGRLPRVLDCIPAPQDQNGPAEEHPGSGSILLTSVQGKAT
jgi:hypothetical protein